LASPLPVERLTRFICGDVLLMSHVTLTERFVISGDVVMSIFYLLKRKGNDEVAL
jgi:hypothetical protein